MGTVEMGKLRPRAGTGGAPLLGIGLLVVGMACGDGALTEVSVGRGSDAGQNRTDDGGPSGGDGAVRRDASGNPVDGGSGPNDSGRAADGGGGGADTGPGGGTDAGRPTPPRVATACDPADPTLTAHERTLLELPADSWYSVPGTSLDTNCPPAHPDCHNVISAWSGGAFDPNHNRMLVFGGGHVDYGGNEVHAFDVGTMTWSRLYEPSPESYRDQDPLPDGQPVSRHSYDGLQYLTQADKFLAHGGSRWYDGSGTPLTWLMEPNGTWTNARPTNSFDLATCCSEASVYDENAGIAYFHVTKKLMSYDPVDNRWTQRLGFGSPPLWPRYEVWGDKTGTFDSSRNLAWFFGSGLYMVYDTQAQAMVTDAWITTGGSTFDNDDVVGGYDGQRIITGGNEVIRAQGPGVAYGKASDSIVAWIGGAPWILDLQTRIWSRGSASGAPASQVQRGTYGRWRYIERTNVFILVNESSDDVHFYKHTTGCGAP